MWCTTTAKRSSQQCNYEHIFCRISVGCVYGRYLTEQPAHSLTYVEISSNRKRTQQMWILQINPSTRSGAHTNGMVENRQATQSSGGFNRWPFIWSWLFKYVFCLVCGGLSEWWAKSMVICVLNAESDFRGHCKQCVFFVCLDGSLACSTAFWWLPSPWRKRTQHCIFFQTSTYFPFKLMAIAGYIFDHISGSIRIPCR